MNTEKQDLMIGFMPLSDCAPLVIGQELNFFAEESLNVVLMRQNSWATLRDKLHAGLLDAAQMLAPMPLASHFGCGVTAKAMSVPFILSYNGNGITLSKELFTQAISLSQLSASEVLADAMPAVYLKEVIKWRKKEGLRKLQFATVFPYSCHYYQLASWLEAGGIELTEVEILVIPPAGMVDAMSDGRIDGFCVGSPWNAAAVRRGIGVTVITSQDIWPDTPEKVLGITQQWQFQNPETLKALLRALKKACQWLNNVPNRFEAARILTRPEYLNADLDIVAPALLDSCITQNAFDPRAVRGYNNFGLETGGNCARTHYAQFLMEQMHNCGHLGVNAQADQAALDIYQSLDEYCE